MSHVPWKAGLYAPLPQRLGGGKSAYTAPISISNVLPTPSKLTLPSNESLHNRIRNRALHLDSVPPKSTTIPPISSKDKVRRVAKGKVSLPKSEQKYSLYEPLRQLWNEYATTVLAGVDANGGIWNVGDRVLRMDLHGAVVEVVRAKDVGLVGVKGVLVAETANTVIIVTEKNRAITVPKDVAVIRLEIADKAVEVFLPALRFRASERSARKIKKKHFAPL